MGFAMDVDTLLHEANRVSAADAHALLHRVVDALTSAAERQVADAWHEEITRRVEELDSGRATPVPWTVVKQRLHARRPSW